MGLLLSGKPLKRAKVIIPGYRHCCRSWRRIISKRRTKIQEICIVCWSWSRSRGWGRSGLTHRRCRLRDSSDLRIRRHRMRVAVVGLSIEFPPLVGIQDEIFEDPNITPRLRPTAGPTRRSVLKPRVAGMVISGTFEQVHFAHFPTAHGETFASMRDGLVRRFALIAHKRPEFDADGAEAELLLQPTIGTLSVPWEPRESPDLLLSWSQI